MPLSVDRGALAYTKTEADGKFVHLTGAETVAGVKNFIDNQTGANISQLNMGICDTAQATTLKEVTLTGYVPKQGDTFKVLMTNASVASASLRVNEGTTYQIRVASSTTTTTSSWTANTICEFYFDGTYMFLISRMPANSTTTPTFYTNISGSSASSTSSTYSTGGIIGVNTISNLADNTDKWAYFGTLTMSYNSTYSYGQSVNQCILFNEYSRGEIVVDDLEVFQIQIKASMPAVSGSSATFNSTVPAIAIDVSGKTNLTKDDICALVYSSTTSTKIIRLYVRLKTPDKHYSTNPICYGNNSYSSAGVASRSYITYVGASVQAVIAELPTPAQGDITYSNIYHNYVLPTASSSVLGGVKVGTDLAIASGVLNIGTAKVTLEKMADVAEGTVFYRKTASTGVPEVQTLATLKTDMDLDNVLKTTGSGASLTAINWQQVNAGTSTVFNGYVGGFTPTTGAWTKFPNLTVQTDPQSEFNSSTQRFVSASNQNMLIFAGLLGSTAQNIGIRIYRNGSYYKQVSMYGLGCYFRDFGYIGSSGYYEFYYLVGTTNALTGTFWLQKFPN